MAPYSERVTYLFFKKNTNIQNLAIFKNSFYLLKNITNSSHVHKYCLFLSPLWVSYAKTLKQMSYKINN